MRAMPVLLYLHVSKKATIDLASDHPNNLTFKATLIVGYAPDGGPYPRCGWCYWVRRRVARRRRAMPLRSAPVRTGFRGGGRRRGKFAIRSKATNRLCANRQKGAHFPTYLTTPMGAHFPISRHRIWYFRVVPLRAYCRRWQQYPTTESKYGNYVAEDAVAVPFRDA